MQWKKDVSVFLQEVAFEGGFPGGILHGEGSDGGIEKPANLPAKH